MHQEGFFEASEDFNEGNALVALSWSWATSTMASSSLRAACFEVDDLVVLVQFLRSVELGTLG